MAVRYYVRAEVNRNGAVMNYAVYDCVAGMESQHEVFAVGDKGMNARIAQLRANATCARLNAEMIGRKD